MSVRTSGTEWVGGRVATPISITELTRGAEPYRLETFLWVELPGGVIVGQAVVRPDDERGALGRALKEAISRPLYASPRRPSALRVADAALAAEARAVVGRDVPVTVAATPELEEVWGAVFEAFFGFAEAARADTRVPKVGRNDSCPCGSGKKYKKCHLRADRPPRARSGQMPIEAPRTPSSREVIELMLSEMEHAERRRPGGTRLDFAALRRQLGLD